MAGITIGITTVTLPYAPVGITGSHMFTATPPVPVTACKGERADCVQSSAVMANAKSFFPEEHPNYIGTYWGQARLRSFRLRLRFQLWVSAQSQSKVQLENEVCPFA